MAGECKDCRYWRPRKWGDGLCVLLSNRDGGPTDGEVNGEIEATYTRKAGSVGHYDYSVDFVTYPDFGCNQFEAKP